MDSICFGEDTLRLLRLDDKGTISNLCASIKDMLRWRRTLFLTPAHEPEEDLEYDGLILQGHTFLINNTGASREHANSDEADTDEFQPEFWVDILVWWWSLCLCMVWLMIDQRALFTLNFLSVCALCMRDMPMAFYIVNIAVRIREYDSSMVNLESLSHFCRYSPDASISIS
jgi:hypothetical protein